MDAIEAINKCTLLLSESGLSAEMTVSTAQQCLKNVRHLLTKVKAVRNDQLKEQYLRELLTIASRFRTICAPHGKAISPNTLTDIDQLVEDMNTLINPSIIEDANAAKVVQAIFAQNSVISNVIASGSLDTLAEQVDSFMALVSGALPVVQEQTARLLKTRNVTKIIECIENVLKAVDCLPVCDIPIGSVESLSDLKELFLALSFDEHERIPLFGVDNQ